MRRREVRPIWTTSSFLVYTGGLTVLGGGIGALAYLSSRFPGHGQQTAWALLIYVILFAVAYLLRRGERPIAAGIFAFISVVAWIVLVALDFAWWGWKAGSIRHWSWAGLAELLLILLVAWDARRRFGFPFIRAISAVVFFLFVNQLLPAGGNWTAAWALIVGLAYLVVGNVSDKPSAFWLHIVGGGLIGGAIIYWCHTTDFDFAVVAFMSFVFVVWAYWTQRSSWAFWGTVGFFIATVHYLVGSPTSIASNAINGQPPNISAWSFPLAFGILGFWLVFLGLLGQRNRPAAVVVQETVVVETPPPTPPPAPAPE